MNRLLGMIRRKITSSAMFTAFAAVAALSLVPACAGEGEEDQYSAAQESAVDVSDKSLTNRERDTGCQGCRHHRMEGIEVSGENLSNGSQLTFTSDDTETVQRIQEMVRRRATSKGHCGKHQGPFALNDVTLSAENLPNGARLIFTSDDTAIVQNIQEMVRRRAAGIGSCGGDCKGNCGGDCKGNCDGNCQGNCDGRCDGDCQGHRAGHCKGNCERH